MVAILQPSYLPWLGYFEQIDRSDVFVFYDDVQYDKHGWRNRNKIKTPKGWQWLTVPVYHNFGQKIYEVKINNNIPWRRKHLKSLQANYARAPYYQTYIKFFEKVYSQHWEYLVDLNVYLIKQLCEFLGIKNTEFVHSRDLNIKGERTERLVKICQLFGADEYLTGDAAKNYLEEKKFQNANIKVIYQNYRHPVYPQLFGEFIPYLSVVDLLFNCGPKSLEIIRSGKP
jgi:hypothetical protein